MEFVTGQQGIGRAQCIRARARPAVIVGMPDRPGTDRIELNVAAAGEKVRFTIDRPRCDIALPTLQRLMVRDIPGYAGPPRDYPGCGPGEVKALFPAGGAAFARHSGPMTADHIFTFGYEGLSLDAFIGRLKVAGVRTVLDVRANPVSRKPGFSKRGFSAALQAAGITYAHHAAMGCPKPVRDRYKRDGDWPAYTRGFLAHLEGQVEALAELAQISRHSPSCLVCFEADFNRCHRTYVAQAAAELGGLRVTHLTLQTEFPGAAARSAA
jgi:hypothetical protein